jgi:hypothetical protein
LEDEEFDIGYAILSREKLIFDVDHLGRSRSLSVVETQSRREWWCFHMTSLHLIMFAYKVPVSVEKFGKVDIYRYYTGCIVIVSYSLASDLSPNSFVYLSNAIISTTCP